jgi:hypothetical protein
MSHTDPGQPDLAALRAAAEGAEFTQAEAALTSLRHPGRGLAE